MYTVYLVSGFCHCALRNKFGAIWYLSKVTAMLLTIWTNQKFFLPVDSFSWTKRTRVNFCSTSLLTAFRNMKNSFYFTFHVFDTHMISTFSPKQMGFSWFVLLLNWMRVHCGNCRHKLHWRMNVKRDGDGRVNPLDFTLRYSLFSPSNIPKIIVCGTFMLAPHNSLPLSI